MSRAPAAVALLVIVVFAAAAPAVAAPAHRQRAVCGGAPPRGYATCTALERTTPSGAPLVTPAAAGLGPADLWSAYAVPLDGTGLPSGGQVIAVVVAYDAPTAEADLGDYRESFGLPPCTVASGCLRKVDQRGRPGPFPRPDPAWAQEAALDLQVSSAICPRCSLLLVEAASPSFANLGAATAMAASLGATQIVNSFGGAEPPTAATVQSAWNQPGVDIVAAAGDAGYGVLFPSTSQYVTAAGGTSLTRDAGTARGWSETVWGGTGSGCSTRIAKPAWQVDGACVRRATTDQAAVADPATGVAVYDTYPVAGRSGWFVLGGTSVAAPVIAALDAVAGGRAADAPYGSFPYVHPEAFRDVASGGNGACAIAVLCTGGAGWDGPTGVGSPIAGSPPSPSAPSVIAAPVITGVPATTKMLSASVGAWRAFPAPAYAYQWLRCRAACAPITGAVARTYTPVLTDVDATLAVTVTATNASGAADTTSAQTAPVVATRPDYALALSPATQDVRRGDAVAYDVTVNAVGGFTGPVALTVSGAPSGSAITTVPAAPGAPGAVTVTTSARAALRTFTLKVTGSSGALRRSATAGLQVLP